MDKAKIILEVSDYVKAKQSGESTGHDWWHTYRVFKTAEYLAKVEKADEFVVQLAALLHDIADWKFSNGDKSAGSKIITELLEKYDVDDKIIHRVCNIINNSSFMGNAEKNRIKSLEGKVVQDADRLDALGAIGIARIFAYGGYDSREIYNPDIKPNMSMNLMQYKNNKSSSINHFYEKILLLKDKLNTDSAKKIANDRHDFVLMYLDEFYKEWDAKY